MTLGDFLNVCKGNASFLLFFLIAVPLTAFLSGIFGKGQGDKSPWSYLYMILLYLACIPGIFVFILNIYLIVIEKSSLLNINLYTQILPIISMMITLWLIKWNVSYDKIPGFNRISGLLTLLTVLVSLFWILEKTHIYVFTYMPFWSFALLFVGLLVLIRFGIKRIL